MYDLISIGEMLIDFTPSGNNAAGFPLYAQNPGGAPANVACAMAKLGGKTAFVGKVGKDTFGLACKKALEDAGCDSRYLAFSPLGTTLAFVTLAADGNRDFSFYRNATTADVNLRPEDIPGEVYTGGKIFHFGSLSLTEEPCRTTTLEAVRKAKAAGALISYDPNLRPPLWSSLEEAKTMILEAMPLADMVKISEEEREFLFGSLPEDQVGVKLSQEYGAKITVITKAKNGCTAFANGRRYDAGAYAVDTIDTTGAGDAFWAGFLLKLLQTGKVVDQLSDTNIGYMLAYANALGSLVTTKRGAIAAIPTEDEIETCIANVPIIK